MYMSQSRQKNCLHFGHVTQRPGMFPTNHIIKNQSGQINYNLKRIKFVAFGVYCSPGFKRLCWQPKQFLGRRCWLGTIKGATSSNGVTGNKWWYDLAKWGEETRVNPQIRHSVGNSQTRALHLGQVYPPPNLASLWHEHMEIPPSAVLWGNPILIKLAIANSAIAGGGGACSSISSFKCACKIIYNTSSQFLVWHCVWT